MTEKETAPWFRFLNAMNRAGKALTPAERTVLGVLFSYADGPDKSTRLMNARPGLDVLVPDTGLSRSTVQRQLTSLEGKGWIVVTGQGGRKGGRGWATCYRLTVPVDNPGKGVTREALSDEERVSPETERVSPVTEKGVTRDTPPPHDLLNTSKQSTSSTISPAAPVDNFADNDEPASASAAQPVAQDGDGCLIDDHDDGQEEPPMPEDHDHDDLTPDALAALDQIQADSDVPTTPDHLAELDHLDPPEEPDDHQEPTGAPLPQQSGDAGRPKTTTAGTEGTTVTAELGAPAALLNRFRAKSHPARTDSLAANLADKWGMPA